MFITLMPNSTHCASDSGWDKKVFSYSKGISHLLSVFV